MSKQARRFDYEKIFWMANEQFSFGTTAIALYFYLLKISNELHWKNTFYRSNAKIQADLSVSFNTLKKARELLKKHGLIDFKTESGFSNVWYKLVFSDTILLPTSSNFDEGTDEGTDEGADDISNTTYYLTKTKTKTKDICGKNDFPPTPQGEKKSLPLSKKNSQLKNQKANLKAEQENTPPVPPAPPSSRNGKKRFAKPTVEQITTYCTERKNDVSPQKFFDYYESNGWRVGKNPMVCWKAAVRTWEKNELSNLKQHKNGNHKPTNTPAIADGQKDYDWNGWKPGQQNV